MTMVVNVAIRLSLFAVVAVAFPAFYIRIPNGDRVPHVCQVPNASVRKVRFWPAVGHWRAKGGDGSKYSLNPFGRDFAANNFRWTEDLCRNDSDLDGRSNGEELGDPDCQWRQNSHVPPVGPPVSHPGVCEPIDAERCLLINAPLYAECPAQIAKQPAQDDPETEQTVCPAINGASVKKFELKLTGAPAKVSIMDDAEKEIVHFCQAFTLPADQNYHMIAMVPSTAPSDNFFVSHVTMHACIDHMDAFNLAAVGGLNVPSKTACRLRSPCKRLVGTWKFDPRAKVPMVCLSSLVGIRFGETRFQKVVVDFHYAFKDVAANNMDPVVDLASSGVTLFYTPKLRRYDLGVILLGENFIKIPPNKQNFSIVASLTSSCLAHFVTNQRTITPIHASLHANKMFKSLQLTLHHQAHFSGTTLAGIQREECVDQTQAFYATKIGNTLLRSTDGLELTCTYDSVDSSQFTFYGPPPDGETCYGAISFYPSDNETWFIDATQFGGIKACSSAAIVDGCPYVSFAVKYQEIIKTLRQACDSSVFPPTVCPIECKTLIVRSDLLGHDCLTGDIFQKIVRSPELMTATLPFTPYEAAAVAGTIELCRLEVYSVVIEKAGLRSTFNKTLENEYALTRVETCRGHQLAATTSLLAQSIVFFFVTFITRRLSE